MHKNNERIDGVTNFTNIYQFKINYKNSKDISKYEKKTKQLQSQHKTLQQMCHFKVGLCDHLQKEIGWGKIENGSCDK